MLKVTARNTFCHICFISAEFDLPFIPHLLAHYNDSRITSRCFVLHFPFEVDEVLLSDLERKFPCVRFVPVAGQYSSRKLISEINRMIPLVKEQWILKTDADEFICDLHKVLSEAGKETVWALMKDRWFKKGVLYPIQPHTPLEIQFPIEANTTQDVGMNILKPVVISSDKRFRNSHSVVGEVDPNYQDVQFRIFHYKWTVGRLNKLQRRVGLEGYGVGYKTDLSKAINEIEETQLPWPVINVGLCRCGTTYLNSHFETYHIPCTHNKAECQVAQNRFYSGQSLSKKIYTEAVSDSAQNFLPSLSEAKVIFTHRDYHSWMVSRFVLNLHAWVVDGVEKRLNSDLYAKSYARAETRLKLLQAGNWDFKSMDVRNRQDVFDVCCWLGLPLPLKHLGKVNSSQEKLEQIRKQIDVGILYSNLQR